MSQVEIQHAGAYIVIRPDVADEHMAPCVWFQPYVKGASMCLSLTEMEARQLAAELIKAANVIKPRLSEGLVEGALALATVEPEASPAEDEAWAGLDLGPMTPDDKQEPRS